MSKIYICYEKETPNDAEKASNFLMELGYEVIYVKTNNESILDDPASEMISSIKSCDKFLCLYNDYSLVSKITDAQVHFAFTKGKDIFIARTTKHKINASLQFLIGAKEAYGRSVKEAITNVLKVK